MIRKPPSDWETKAAPSVPAAPLARATASAMSTGLSGVRRTYAVVRAAYVGFMALILAFGALSAGLLGHNLIAMIGAGTLSFLAGWWALRLLRGALGEASPAHARQDFVPDGTAATEIAFGRKTTPARAPQGFGTADTPQGLGTADTPQASMAPGQGTSYAYTKPKLLLHVFRMLGFIAILAFVAETHPRSFLLVGLLLAVCVLAAWHVCMVLVKLLSGNLVALSWDDRQIAIHALQSTYQVPWHSVSSCEARRRTTRVLGLIPVATTGTLTLRLIRNGRRKRVNLQLHLIDMSDDAVRRLAARITAQRAAAI